MALFAGYATVACYCRRKSCAGATTCFFSIDAPSHAAARAVFEDFLEEHGDAAGAALWPDAPSAHLVGWSVDPVEHLPSFDGVVKDSQ
ncbi:hypothetical protein [Myxococcus sp. CA040A]|uniref:hypothetical protein n=1 Tax=Myxococcus sp. CA040A TaxID=2741738 RepID=UPI00157B38B0|nr:hypothetical protein [Myxococcus sp. CA040A]NTX08954.1 hypothetical protein [Myxococcus sp. CA040A]